MNAATVDVGNGVRLYYEERGEGPVLLFVHGMWGTCRFFHKQFAGLSERFRLIALDLRGHGRSSMTLEDQTVPSYARDLRAFIDALGLREFIGVGWSMGALVWWDYYLQFGVAGLRGLIDIDQPPSDWRSPEIPGGLLDVAALRDWHYRLQTDRNGLMRDVIPMMFARPPGAADTAWMLDEMTRAPAVIAAAEMIDQSLREYQHMLFDYPVPTLACTGAHSAQPRAGMQMIVDRVRQGRLQVFEGCGHCLFLEDAPAFNRGVAEFVAELA
ncbi:MAG TPA: alpha/beta hydrolase [Steroidobacteraceae bacterium]|nr:alpha/beta hydrolase [Steroidobacteraceae bacterium]